MTKEYLDGWNEEDLPKTPLADGLESIFAELFAELNSAASAEV